jgi:hypothetical protein
MSTENAHAPDPIRPDLTRTVPIDTSAEPPPEQIVSEASRDALQQDAPIRRRLHEDDPDCDQNDARL